MRADKKHKHPNGLPKSSCALLLQVPASLRYARSSSSSRTGSGRGGMGRGSPGRGRGSIDVARECAAAPGCTLRSYVVDQWWRGEGLLK